MSPLVPRRRSRRRSAGRRLIPLVAALVVAGVIIGGFSQVGRQSGSYNASVDRSIAAQGSVLAQESNTTAGELRTLLAGMQRDTRLGLQADLDNVVAQAAGQATRAEALAAPVAVGDLGSKLAGVFVDRAQAVVTVRTAIDGLLGMHPLTVAGTAPAAGTHAGVPATLTATQVTDRIAGAGALLARADLAYREVVRALARSAGHATLPPSVWVSDPQLWQVGSVATQVDLVAVSGTLVVTHDLVLRSVRLVPQALPPPSGTPQPFSTLPPTTTVQVSIVLANEGSVDEPHASVQCTLALLPSGVTKTQTRTTSLDAARSTVLAPVTFGVKSGKSYQLTVAVVPAAGQVAAPGSSLTQTLQIAPST